MIGSNVLFTLRGFLGQFQLSSELSVKDYEDVKAEADDLVETLINFVDEIWKGAKCIPLY